VIKAWPELSESKRKEFSERVATEAGNNQLQSLIDNWDFLSPEARNQIMEIKFQELKNRVREFKVIDAKQSLKRKDDRK